MAKVYNKELILEEKLEQALVPEDEQPYKVPNNWVWTKLNYVALYKKGPFGSSLTKAMFVPKSTKTYKVYEQGNAIRKDINYGSYYITEDKYQEMKGFKVEPGDIIVSCAGTVGETFELPKGIEPGIINQALMKVKVSRNINKKYYLLYFDKMLRTDITGKSKGTAIKNIPPFLVLKDLSIPIPPPAEQNRIVNRIESLFEKLDQAKKLAQNALDTFETRKAAILHKTFTGELTAQWRDINGVKMDSWDERSIDDLFFVFSGKGFKEKEYSTEGVKLLRISNVANNNLTWEDTKYLPFQYLETEKDLFLKQNDIVMALNRPITNNKLKISMVGADEHYILYQRVGCMRLKMEGSSHYFLYYMLSNEFKKQVELNLQGSDQPYINLPPLKKITCPVCTHYEQEEIVRILDNLSEKEEEAKELCKDLIDKIDLMKKSILARAFRGELGTNDSSEESAIELLKKCL